MYAGGLYGNGWSNVTYEIDISEYDISHGTTIVLADYASHVAAYEGEFDPAAVIIDAGDSGLDAMLSFDTATSSLVLTITDAN